MKIAVLALTRNGSELALKLAEKLDANVFIKPEFEKECTNGIKNVFPIESTLSMLVEKIFNEYDALIFIMACGIVVRTIAPFIKSKSSDPAVIVMDEKGKHVISLLSGHLGGANLIAMEIAKKTGGTAVITTSTDVNGVISFDVFAVENNCYIENIENLKYISTELVNGRKIVLFTDCKLKGSIPENIKPIFDISAQEHETLKYWVILSNRTDMFMEGRTVLLLRPKNLILGIGCKRDTTKEQIQKAVKEFLLMNKKSINSIKCLATIDLKKDEKGLLEFCSETGLELRIIPRTEIESIEGNYTCSEFVKEKVGVASVAEPCSVLGSKNGRLICKKTAYQGITLALTEEENEYSISQLKSDSAKYENSCDEQISYISSKSEENNI
jgi:cobalt-precorrin 5A hydrolase